MPEYDTDFGYADVEIYVSEMGGSGKCLISGASIKTDGELEFDFANDINRGEPTELEVTIRNEDGRANMTIAQTEGRIHLFHLFVTQSMRGHRIGKFLIDVFKQFCSKCGLQLVSGRIGNGGTKEFLIKQGFPEEHLEKSESRTGKEVVAIGRGNAERGRSIITAMKDFEGFSKRKIQGVK